MFITVQPSGIYHIIQNSNDSQPQRKAFENIVGRENAFSPLSKMFSILPKANINSIFTFILLSQNSLSLTIHKTTKILDSTKLKACVDKKKNFAKIMISVFDRAENIVGK